MDVFRGSTETAQAYMALEKAIIRSHHESVQRPSLVDLAIKHGADKGDNCKSYEKFIVDRRDDILNLLEIGVGGFHDNPQSGGGSLRMWREYFAKAEIVGIDYYDKSPHADERIRVRQGSQSDEEFLLLITEEIGGIDIIIDDGSHVSKDVVKSFEVLFPFLRSGGTYIVEDTATSYWPERGGSLDLNDPVTSMNYFKKKTDELQWMHSKGLMQENHLASQINFVHFGCNFIVIGKQ